MKFSFVVFLASFILATSRVQANPCENSAISAPKGKLSSVMFRHAGGSTGGKWMKDEDGVVWFVKKDMHYPELQTSAEPIAARIYSHFGYNTPVTYKVIIKGVHHSASRDAGETSGASNFSDRNTSEIRQMRVVAAYLKDWDRLANHTNNQDMPDGSLLVLDFGGTLGSRARGEYKPGNIVSKAIGSFESTEDIKTIYTSFGISAGNDHPWKKITKDDAEKVIEKFKTLTDEKITAIVKTAQYSNPSDESYMIEALKTRRNGIIKNLLSVIP